MERLKKLLRGQDRRRIITLVAIEEDNQSSLNIIRFINKLTSSRPCNLYSDPSSSPLSTPHLFFFPLCCGANLKDLSLARHLLGKQQIIIIMKCMTGWQWLNPQEDDLSKRWPNLIRLHQLNHSGFYFVRSLRKTVAIHPLWPVFHKASVSPLDRLLCPL